MRISVFGNPDLPADALPVSLIPELKQQFPDIEFVHQDPNEDCEPLGSPWVIIDTVKGLPGVRIIKDIELLKHKKTLTMHDYDLGLHLVLLKKIHPDLAIRIIGVPAGYDPRQALEEIAAILKSPSVSTNI